MAQSARAQTYPGAAKAPRADARREADDRSNQAPERPSLAPDVTLSGEMEDSAFADSQWLAQRDGQFVQLTELLYRVLENMDGRRTLGEIAERVSEAIDRAVTEDNVRYLIEKKLIPRGLVVREDGSIADTSDGPRSALQINMKTRVVSGEVIKPLTRVFQYLYIWPIVVAVLAATAAITGWLYFVHGVAQSIRTLLYEPALMLILLPIIIIVTAFHELGHAAALRYGGGEVRGMGFGLYLIYPAFYTDVTDNYRLGRWARVRTDLGGFYFNLIFALVMVALWVVTRQELFLLVVFFIHLDILHQILPFVRLDGYWALADMTGVPDFFSEMGPFLRSVLPISRWQGQKLPNLKGWVKAVFAAYIVITVPLLLAMLFFMVKGVPRILATAVDSMGKQVSALGVAHNAGDGMGMAVAAVQLLILALPTLGLIYMLFTLGRRLLGALWRWSKPTPARRAAGSLITVGLAAGLVYLWTPQLPFGGASGPALAEVRWTPIQNNESGTVSSAFHSQPSLPPSTTKRAPAVTKPPRKASTSATTGTPGTRPTGTAAAAAAKPTGTPTPVATGTPQPTAEATAPAAAATWTPTPQPPAVTPTPAPATAAPTEVPTAAATVQPTEVPTADTSGTTN